jgi:hypothetical protein
MHAEMDGVLVSADASSMHPVEVGWCVDYNRHAVLTYINHAITGEAW